MSIWSWFGGIFHSIKVKIAPLVVSILEVIKNAEESGMANTIAEFIDKALHSHVAEDVNAIIKKNVYNAIAAFLAIEGLPDNPTDEQLKDFVNKAAVALAGKKATETVKGKVYQDFTVQLYDIIRREVDAAKLSHVAITANDIARDLEEAYQDYKADLAAAENASADDANNN